MQLPSTVVLGSVQFVELSFGELSFDERVLLVEVTFESTVMLAEVAF